MKKRKKEWDSITNIISFGRMKEGYDQYCWRLEINLAKSGLGTV
jgi:hypothetical protein